MNTSPPAALANLKSELLAAIDLADEHGKYSDADFDRVIDTIHQLVPLSPVSAPLDQQDKITAPWGTLFASFGPRHTAGKPVVHETNLSLQSFARFPKTPIRVLDIVQEIEHQTRTYSNVTTIETIDASTRARLIVHGRYRDTDGNRQRYLVDFYEAELQPIDSADEPLAEAFDLPVDSPLSIPLKPPKLHSDVVYCDDDIRINFGSMNGVYVMQRLSLPFVAVGAVQS
ncbi:MAG: PAP/fibrillin family protein [Woeseiaceae bacterium]